VKRTNMARDWMPTEHGPSTPTAVHTHCGVMAGTAGLPLIHPDPCPICGGHPPEVKQMYHRDERKFFASCKA